MPEPESVYLDNLPERLREIAIALEAYVLDDDGSKLDMICIADILTAARELELSRKAEPASAP